MEYAYATCILGETGEEINEENLTAVLEAAGCSVIESRVKAIVAALEEVDVAEVTAIDVDDEDAEQFGDRETSEEDEADSMTDDTDSMTDDNAESVGIDSAEVVERTADEGRPTEGNADPVGSEPKDGDRESTSLEASSNTEPSEER